MRIRYKLTLQFTLLAMVILLIFCGLIYYRAAKQNEQNFYKQLNERAYTTAYIFLEEDEFSSRLYQTVKERYQRTLSHEISMFFDEDNNPAFLGLSDEVTYSNELIDYIRDKEYHEFKDGARQAVGIYYRDNQGDFVIISSAVDVTGKSYLNNLFRTLLAGFIVITALLFIAGYFFAYQALKPISQVVKKVNTISVSNLSVRLEEGNKVDEIAVLAGTFNKMLDRFEDSFKIQERFVANASHELRTPLTSILGELEVALEKPRTDQEYKAVLQSVYQDTLTLKEMITGLLNLAEAESEKIFEMMQPMRLDEVIIDAAVNTESRYPASKIKISYLNEKAEEDDYILPANRALLFNAFGNILDNALKYSPDNQEAEISIYASDQKIEFLVKDKGMGISETEISHIYDPFFRSRNVSQYKGYGIGLSLVKRVLSLLNGTIQISSEPDKGTLVTVTFLKHPDEV